VRAISTEVRNLGLQAHVRVPYYSVRRPWYSPGTYSLESSHRSLFLLQLLVVLFDKPSTTWIYNNRLPCLSDPQYCLFLFNLLRLEASLWNFIVSWCTHTHSSNPLFSPQHPDYMCRPALHLSLSSKPIKVGIPKFVPHFQNALIELLLSIDYKFRFKIPSIVLFYISIEFLTCRLIPGRFAFMKT